MKKVVLKGFVTGAALFMALTGGAQALRPPAVPLISVDPFFSVWSPGDRLSDAPTEHWSLAKQPINIVLWVNGAGFRLMGSEPANLPAMPQAGLTVWPLRTVAVFSNETVAAELTFATPKLAEDLEVFSRPVTYLTFKARSLDNQPKSFRLKVEVDAAIAVGDDKQEVVFGKGEVKGAVACSMGRKEQPVLGRAGDRIRIDWGYFWLAAPSIASITERAAEGERKAALCFMQDMATTTSAETHLLLAYDDIESVLFFERPLKAWWRRKGVSFTDMLAQAERDYAPLMQRMREFDRELMADLRKVGGDKYAELAALSYRQSFAACKLVADPNQQPLYFSKENDSGGLIGTVDVFYPQLPLLTTISPTLARASFAPILLYASDTRWPFDFAPHDIGCYPIGNGQVYGEGERGEYKQMPVEESGNMLICLGTLAHIEKSAEFAAQWWPTVTRWADFLAQKGFDPDNQLCTDDFAGHLAHNANLSIKAIMGLGCYAKMAGMLGDTAAEKRYMDLAKSMVPRWITAAQNGRNGAYRLAFDQPDSWSMKYNLVWDRILGFNIFPREVAQTEMAHYHTVTQKYGLPLDNRKLYTKADWLVWCATLTGNRNDFDRVIEPLYRFANETPDRVAFSDWYQTDSAKYVHFIGRSVVGGVFLPLLYDQALWQKYAQRDTATTGLYAPLKPREDMLQKLPPAAPFRYASYNIRCPIDKTPNSWAERAPRVRTLISKHNFDMVGLQEATWGQMQDLLQMEGWTFVGVGRDDGKQKGEASCIFFTTNRFELLASDTFWLSETPEVPGSKSWDTACTRVCTWADFKDRKTGRTFMVFNTHLDHISKMARQNGMNLILSRMARHAQGRPALLSGDMNTYPDSGTFDINIMLRDTKNNGPKDPNVKGPYTVATSNLHDSYEITQTPHKGPLKTFTGFKFQEKHEGLPIDFIFVSGDVKVVSHATLDDSENQLYPSDHFPVVAEIILE